MGNANNLVHVLYKYKAIVEPLVVMLLDLGRDMRNEPAPDEASERYDATVCRMAADDSLV